METSGKRKGINFHRKKKILSTAKFRHPRRRNGIMWEVTQEEGEAQEIVAALYRQTTEAKPRTRTCLAVKLRFRVSLPERAKYSSCRQPSTASPSARPPPPPSSLSHLMNGPPQLPAVSCAQTLQAFVVPPRHISILKPQSTCFAVPHSHHHHGYLGA